MLLDKALDLVANLPRQNGSMWSLHALRTQAAAKRTFARNAPEAGQIERRDP